MDPAQECTITVENGASDNRVLVELVGQVLEAQKEKEKAFFALAERFRILSRAKDLM